MRNKANRLLLAAGLLLLSASWGCSSRQATAGDGSEVAAGLSDADASLDTEEFSDVQNADDHASQDTTDIAVDTAADDADATPLNTDATADTACTEAACACKANADCDSGFCLEVNGQQQCAALCAAGCPADFKCSQLSSSGGDIVNVCTPAAPRICEARFGCSPRSPSNRNRRFCTISF